MHAPILRGLLAVVLLALLAACGKPKEAELPAGSKVLALGDSLTAGYGLEPGQSFPARLEAALKAKGLNVKVHNAGVSGDTASAGLSRLDWALSGLPGKPDLVILELGANDMLRGVDPAVTKKALGDAIRRLRARNIDVMIAGMRAAPNLGADYAKKFDAMYEELAREYGVLLYPFLLDGVALDERFMQPDGLHPNAQGQPLVLANVWPVLKPLLER